MMEQFVNQDQKQSEDKVLAYALNVSGDSNQFFNNDTISRLRLENCGPLDSRHGISKALERLLSRTQAVAELEIESQNPLPTTHQPSDENHESKGHTINFEKPYKVKKDSSLEIMQLYIDEFQQKLSQLCRDTHETFTLIWEKYQHFVGDRVVSIFDEFKR